MTTQRVVLDDAQWAPRISEVAAQLRALIRRGSFVCCPPSTDGRTHLTTAAGTLLSVDVVDNSIHMEISLLDTPAGRRLETLAAKAVVLRPVLRGMGSGPRDFALSGVDISAGP